MNGDKHFIDVPGIAQTSLSFFQLAGIARAKFLAPLSNGFLGDDDALFGEEFFHLTEAEAESMVQPDGVTNNFRGKLVTLVVGCVGFHVAQSAKSQLN